MILNERGLVEHEQGSLRLSKAYNGRDEGLPTAAALRRRLRGLDRALRPLREWEVYDDLGAAFDSNGMSTEWNREAATRWLERRPGYGWKSKVWPHRWLMSARTYAWGQLLYEEKATDPHVFEYHRQHCTDYHDIWHAVDPNRDVPCVCAQEDAPLDFAGPEGMCLFPDIDA